jgi:hypothetical protein
MNIYRIKELFNGKSTDPHCRLDAEPEVVQMDDVPDKGFPKDDPKVTFNIGEHKITPNRLAKCNTGCLRNIFFKVNVPANHKIYLECPYSLIQRLVIQVGGAGGTRDMRDYGRYVTKCVQVFQSDDKFKKMFDDCGLPLGIEERKAKQFFHKEVTEDGTIDYYFKVDFPDLGNIFFGRTCVDWPTDLLQGRITFQFTLADNTRLKNIFTGSADNTVANAKITYLNDNVDFPMTYTFKTYEAKDFNPTKEMQKTTTNDVFQMYMNSYRMDDSPIVKGLAPISSEPNFTDILLSPYAYGQQHDNISNSEDLATELLDSCALLPGVLSWGIKKKKTDKEYFQQEMEWTATNNYMFDDLSRTIKDSQDYDDEWSMTADKYNVKRQFDTTFASTTLVRGARPRPVSSFIITVPEKWVYYNDLHIGQQITFAGATGTDAESINGNKVIRDIFENGTKIELISNFTGPINVDNTQVTAKPAVDIEHYEPRLYDYHSQSHRYNCYQRVVANELDRNFEHCLQSQDPDADNDFLVEYNCSSAGRGNSTQGYLLYYVLFQEPLYFKYNEKTGLSMNDIVVTS